ncbi:glycosyltransferase family 39 protein [Candidatus Amesbacteria bacterium]|nr:glycosyltransferase family 39 protein [Candidatus Amesbacteria bacterium]
MKKLIFILILGFVLRVIWLDKFPTGFTADEAGQGYDAYSILKTGRDSWGQFLPLFPRGFGDFKPPLYMYIAIPSVAIFGLTEFAVRLPAALIGVGAIAVIYFLSKELFSEKIAILSAFLLSISPWHIQLSRNAWEGGLGILLFPLGLYLFLKKRYNWAFLAWGVNLYSYHSWRVFTILFVVALVIRQKFFKSALLIFALASLPIILNYRAVLKRASDVGIFSSLNTLTYLTNRKSSPTVFDNKYNFYADQLFTNYLSYFSPSFYFTGHRPDFSHLNFPGTPLHYPVELVFIAIGAILLIRHKQFSYLLIWLLLAPIPAALTESSNSQRAITIFPLTVLISAYGLAVLSRYSKILIPVLLASFIFLVQTYLIKLPKNPIYSQRVNYKEVFIEAISIADKYDTVHFSRVFTVPQMFVAFYSKWDPTDFQKYSQDWRRYEQADKLYVDQLESWNLGKYEFHDFHWEREGKLQNALLISSLGDFPAHQHILFDLYDYRFAEVNPK